VLISDTFRGMRFPERGNPLGELGAPSNSEVKAYTPEGFAEMAEKPNWKRVMGEGSAIVEYYGIFGQGKTKLKESGK